MTDQEVPTWDSNNLPQSWDEALERYGKVPYNALYGGTYITFNDLKEGTNIKYHLDHNIIYYKYNDFFYYYHINQSVYTTFIDGEYLENRVKCNDPRIEIFGFLYKIDPDQIIEMLDMLTTFGQQTKSARK